MKYFLYADYLIVRVRCLFYNLTSCSLKFHPLFNSRINRQYPLCFKEFVNELFGEKYKDLLNSLIGLVTNAEVLLSNCK